MARSDFHSRLEELYLPPSDEFVLVNVPRANYAVVEGVGDPKSPENARLLKWLFAAIHPIKRIARERMGRTFVEPPLEALWWADSPCDFAAARLEEMKWRMMIVLPEWGTKKLLKEGIASASEKLGTPPESLRIEPLREDLSAQIMHIGDGTTQGATIARLHEEFLPANGLEPSGRHHEIYLNDHNRVAARNRKTVLRQPVRKVK